MLALVGSIFLTVMLVAGFALLRLANSRRGQIRFIRGLLHEDAAKPSGGRGVIASLSTLPDRIENLEATLRSLVDQTRPPDEIVLCLPNFSKRQQKSYTVPKYLGKFPSVHVLYCGDDWGPATKFIPVIQRELTADRGDTLIMVVDDDRIYPRDALETYLHYHTKLPNAALCFRGAPMPHGLRWRKPKLCLASRIREPKKVAVIMGCGSYLVQPRFFDARLWDYSSAPAAAFYMDDIWISGWLDRRAVEKYVVPASAMMRTTPSQRGTMTLDEVPNGRRSSNNEVIRFFSDSWNVFLPH